ncbi:MAG: metalloregulator ArsR/SmtB family transcription factor [Pseudomonadota bacterium]
MNMLTTQDDQIHAALYAALAHPARLEILRCLARQRICKCKDVVDALPLAQSTVSQHLKVLVDAGLVKAELGRPASQYSLNNSVLAQLGRTTQSLVETCCAADRCVDKTDGSCRDE